MSVHLNLTFEARMIEWKWDGWKDPICAFLFFLNSVFQNNICDMHILGSWKVALFPLLYPQPSFRKLKDATESFSCLVALPETALKYHEELF